MASHSAPATVDSGPEEVELSVLREQVAGLEADLAECERELDAVRQWASFLEGSLEERAERVDELEARVEDLERQLERERRSGLFGRLRALVG